YGGGAPALDDVEGELFRPADEAHAIRPRPGGRRNVSASASLYRQGRPPAQPRRSRNADGRSPSASSAAKEPTLPAATSTPSHSERGASPPESHQSRGRWSSTSTPVMAAVATSTRARNGPQPAARPRMPSPRRPR